MPMLYFKRLLIALIPVLCVSDGFAATKLDTDVDNNKAQDIAFGGTNAKTAATARENLGVTGCFADATAFNACFALDWPTGFDVTGNYTVTGVWDFTGATVTGISGGASAVNSVNGQTGTVILAIPTASTAAYSASTWNGSTSVPDQNAVRDYLTNFDADGDGSFTDESWYLAITGVSTATENTWSAEQTFSAGITSSGTGAGSITLTESTANGGIYGVTFTPGNLSVNKTIAPENLIQISDIDTEAEFEALLFDLPEGGGASAPSAGIVTSNGTTLSSITPGTGVATALAAAVDGTGGLASKAALDAVVTGSFAFDTYPTYEDSAHSGSGIAVNGATLAVFPRPLRPAQVAITSPATLRP